MATARDLLLAGELAEGLAIIEPASQAGDDLAAFMLAQVLAFQGDWTGVRALCLRLLRKPFIHDPYHEVMQLFALSAISLGDWKVAKESLSSVREHLEWMLDMSSPLNAYAEAFNRLEAFIWSSGKGQLPFKIFSPINYASMTKDQYAKLCSLSYRTANNPDLTLTFDQLDENRKYNFHLWKALYDQDLHLALKLFHDRSEEIYICLEQTLLLAQLLMADRQDDYAWQILKPEIIENRPILGHEIVWLELLWDPKTRPLMTRERCHELLTSDRTYDEDEPEQRKLTKESARLSTFCSLARCLSEEAADILEEQLINDQDNLESRLKLIGAYSKYNALSLAKKKPHISWLIEKYPDSPMIEDLLHHLFLDKKTFEEDFEEFRQKWLKVIEQDPDNTKILFNAALLLGVDDTALAEEMLIRAQTIEPDNVKFAERLYELNAFQVKKTTGRQRLLHAGEALRQIDIQEKLGVASPPHYFSKRTMIGRRAWFSMEVGEGEACQNLIAEMVALAKLEGFEQAYQYLGLVIQGRLALKQGETEKAIKYMMSTLQLQPFTHFRSDNPILTLMAELNEAGQSTALLKFFELNGNQWPEEDSKMLEQFVLDIEAGESPYFSAVRL
jgi:hypothetical protein